MTTALTFFKGTSQPWPISFHESSPVSANRSAASAACQWKANCADVSFTGDEGLDADARPPRGATA